MTAGRTMGGLWSRRAALRSAGLGAVGFTAAGVLAGCGTTPQASASSSAPTVPDRSDIDKKVIFGNWQLYIDVDEDDPNKRPTLDAFSAETGIAVSYIEDIVDAETFYAKAAPVLKAGQAIDRDVVVPTEDIAARMIRQGLVQQWDRTNTPLVTANLLASLREPGWDPGRRYSTPWQAGVTGIAYNAAKTGEVRTMTELLTRADLRGKVTLLTEWRDTVALVMLDQGASPEQFSDDDYAAALAAVQASVDSKQVRRFTGNDYTGDLAKGTIHACLAWSGDVVQLQADNSDIRFVQPESGMMIWADEMVIPNGAEHKKNAELLTNYYYDPHVAATLTEWVQYICPVEGAREAMTKIDKDLVDNTLIFPDDEFLSRAHTVMQVTDSQDKTYAEAYQKVMGA